MHVQSSLLNRGFLSATNRPEANIQRSIPLHSTITRAVDQHLQQQPSADLDLIDSIFEDATMSVPLKNPADEQPTTKATRLTQRLLQQRLQLPHSTHTAAGLGAAAAAAAAAAATTQAAVPVRPASLPWASKPTHSQAAGSERAPQNDKRSALSHSRQGSSNSNRVRTAGTTSHGQRHLRRNGADLKRASDIAVDASGRTIIQAAAGAASLPVVNPWAAATTGLTPPRKFQQKHRKHQQSDSSTTRHLHLPGTTAASDADITEDEQAAELAAAAQYESLASSFTGNTAAAISEQPSETLLRWRPSPALPQQQQQPTPPAHSELQSCDTKVTEAARISSSPQGTLHQTDATDIGSGSTEEDESSTFEAVLARKRAELAAAADMGHLEHQQQPSMQQQQQQQQLPGVDMEGVVRSARHARLAQRQQQTSSRQQQMSLAPAAPTLQAAACADGTTDIGRLPLLVPGGQPRGDKVLWQQQQQQPATAHLAASAAEAAQARGATPQHGHIGSNDTQNSSSSGNMSGAARSNITSSSSSSSSGSTRIRRVRGALQGAVLTTPPPPPTSPHTPLTHPPSLAAAPSTHSSLAVAPSQPQQQHSTPAVLNSSANSSADSSRMPPHGALHLEALDHTNWQQYAQQLLPDLYDPSWHSSMYTLMLDVWPEALAAAADRSSLTDTGESGSQQHQHQHHHQQQQQQQKDASPAVRWALECVAQHSRALDGVVLQQQQQQEKYVWCSAVLALLDCLADDETTRLQQVVGLVPLEVLISRVLPAAAVVDKDLFAGLQDKLQHLVQHQQQQGQGVSSEGEPGTPSEDSLCNSTGSLASPTTAAVEGCGAGSGEQLARLAQATAAAAAAAATIAAGSRQQQWQQQQIGLLSSSFPAALRSQQQLRKQEVNLGLRMGQTTGAEVATDPRVVASAASESAAAAVPAEEVVQALAELAILQSVYPGVQLQALAHVADMHGVWV